MSGNEKWSSGQLISRPSPSTSPMVVDCSNWDASVPGEFWSTGALRAVSQSSAVVETAIREFDVERPNHWTAADLLEVTLRIVRDAEPASVEALATRLIHAIHQVNSALGLTYDTERSRAAPARETEEGRVVIVLRPTRQVESGKTPTLPEIAELIGRAMEQTEITLTGVEFRRAAA